MKRSPKDEGLRWFEQSEADLLGVQVLFDNNLYHLACFIAQQVAEKAIKAFLYARGEQIVTGHSVTALATWAEQFDAAFAALRDEVAILDGYYIPTRYPNGIPDSIPAKVYTRKPAEEALRLAEKTIEFVRPRMGDR
ncbi:MAG: HEPN domain-containing protein [Clostridium sp.]|nr:HEPN domain-containing protein [Clostridium sp.]